MVTVHVPVPEQAPPQPEKVEPVAAVAVRVTVWPKVMEALHVAPQSIAPEAPVTVPVPVPVLATVSAAGGLAGVTAFEAAEGPVCQAFRLARARNV